MKRWRELFVVCFLGAVVSIALVCAGTAGIQAQETTDPTVLPSPYDLVSNLDLSCHKTEPAPPPADVLSLRHLNPVLTAMGVEETYAYLGELEELCAPVVKNLHFPSDELLRYLRWIDLACFEAHSSEALNIPLSLSHLNPVLQEMGLPDEDVILTELSQVCVPVAKNETYPPVAVRQLIKYIDLACFELEAEPIDPFELDLRHLNPVLQELGFEDQATNIVAPKQLCVPVLKNEQQPPEEIVEILKWIDLKKYAVEPLTELPHVDIVLSHLNPLFLDVEPIQTIVMDAVKLAVPVAKNGETPPSE